MSTHSARPQTSFTDKGEPCWHHLSAEAALHQLNSSDAGLSTEEARLRRAKYGLNRMSPPPQESWLLRLARQFSNILIYVLLAAAVVSALLGHWIDGSVILAVVIINALFGLLQEGKAEEALQSLKTLMQLQASILRDGQRQSLPAELLVPGDIVLLESGDRVPADLRLLHGINLRAQESALTGEATSVSKSLTEVAADTPIAERHCLLFAGTLITQGRARAVVTATGDQTELGQIGALLRDVDVLNTPLTTQMSQLGQRLTWIILSLSIAIFLFGWWVHGYPLGTLFMSSVGIAVAAIPEGLPAIITITLAMGVQRMAKRNAIIRRLPAVETLGAVSVICTDKTGTLTCNEMTVQSVLLPEGMIKVSGSGYQAEGAFSLNNQPVSEAIQRQITHLALAGALCNDARFDMSDSHDWQLQGDPTEGALLALAAKAGLHQDHCRQHHPRSQEIPFESEHRYMATLHHPRSGVEGSALTDSPMEALLQPHLLVKGAPEKILPLCRHNAADNQHSSAEAVNLAYWRQGIATLAASGQRVLAIAEKRLPADHPAHHPLTQDNLHDLTLLGLVGISDPLREEVTQAVADCHRAGIRIIMITGDHADTASAIAQSLDLGQAGHPLTGSEIDTLSDEALQQALGSRCVIARASPAHKLRLIQALQAMGHIVAMTGDGVNDAPALKRANVGIAMGLKGTEAAKEAAEMVLADDHFATLRDAVIEGRSVYSNLQKALAFVLPTNGGQALVMVAAILLGTALPMTPVQILWVNMVTAITLALALAFEQSNPSLLQRPPRPPQEALLSGFLLRRISLVSIALAVTSLVAFLWSHQLTGNLALSQTLAINVLVSGEIFYLISCRSLRHSTLNRDSWRGNTSVLISIIAIVVLQLAFTYLPWLNTLFGSTPLPLSYWGGVLLAGLGLYFFVEGIKGVALIRIRFRHHYRPKLR
ncbi:cation-translocating P-type ATPase [Pokkaliibacter sp. CJK22405]|uniref:cation-translocating P-type ATPase n=1 Tax=Pokkaliibacter sp. CJK22405 TaxID=3384615 RepID=UPI0039851CDB